MEASPPHRRARSPWTGAAGELGSLPPELLTLILSRLPLRDAVRTSALARAWRRRWESVPSLKFKWGDGAEPSTITGVLRRYSCPVRKFHHPHVREASFRHSDRWIRLLARKGVQSLSLGFNRSRELTHALHSSIFSCRELTVLDLRGCDIPAMPSGFTGLPNLTVLRLFSVGFPEGPRELGLLIATSPLLETLSLKLLLVHYSNGEDNRWVIQAPKLRRFYIADIDEHGWQINVPSLEEARIECVSDHDFIKLISGFICARKLELHMPIGDVLEGFTCPFNNLRSLTLNTSLSVVSNVLSVFCLLRNAPKLEDLDIKVNDEYSQDDEVDRDFLSAQWMDDLFPSLIRIDVTYMTCKLSEMHFIEFVLSKARRLKEFHVCVDEECSRSNEDAVTELLKYRRASPRAKVFFSRMQYD